MSTLAIQSFFGFFFLLGIAFICSENKKAINWRLILTAFVAQNCLFLIIHYVPIVNSGLHVLSGGLLKFMDYANKGLALFLVDWLIHPKLVLYLLLL
ncbi:Na+ dependent nucleoside transporter N-terminal domain-containing protein [Aquella oligotrophica]|uniref:Concentrative nucleoside transporter N-terminal domain-containing protein n=1 Tax=Aquella oligotrophica TaxID=2067065 RepID=A0A2I7N4W3_9NEIS|nr:hypothetical protein CUN60_04095 [Aquella oligotrophica]